MGAAGIFQLTEGYVKLVLHDDGLKNNEVLMADAVKWVRSGFFHKLCCFYFFACMIAACAAARRAMGTRNGEHET